MTITLLEISNDRSQIELTLTDAATGAMLWQPSLALGNPNTILGYSYYEMPDMTSTFASAEVPILFADFRKAYMIVDKMATSFVRDNTTLQHRGLVRMIMHRWVGGAVARKEAVAKLVIS